MAWKLCIPPVASTWRLIFWGPNGAYKGIRFEPCGVQSFHPDDVRERYCAFCHRWIEREESPHAVARDPVRVEE